MVAYGPFKRSSRHPEQVTENHWYTLRMESAGDAIVVALDGPPSCCRLIKVGADGRPETGYYMSSSSRIDEGEHAVPINVRAHHVRGFRRHAMARASRTVTAWVPSRRPVASCMEKWREKTKTMSTHLDATARRR